jgi:hypothetical protein
MNDACQLFSEGNLIGSFGNLAGLSTPDPPLPCGYNRHEA